MKRSTILALAVAMTTGAGAVMAQTGTSGAPGGPPGSPTAPSMPGPMPRDSGSSVGGGTMSPPATVAPSTEPGTVTSPASPVTPTPMPTQAAPSATEPVPPSPTMATTPPPATTAPDSGMPAMGARGGMVGSEDQARARVEADGYKGVGPLTRGPDGHWQGTAMRGSDSVNVRVDGRGNVTTQ